MSTWIAGKGTIPAVTTNADKIKQAGNESEMASAFMGFLCTASCIGGYCNTLDKACHQCVLDWLKQEAIDEN